MTYTKTLAGSGSYDVTSSAARLLNLWITNNGSGDIYVGDIPIEDITVDVVETTNGDTFIDVASEALAASIQPGMYISNGGTAFVASEVVTKVIGKRIHLSSAAGSGDNDYQVTFSAPAISTSNGHRLASGETAHWSAGMLNHAPSQGKRIVADATGCTVTITAQRA